MIRLRAIRQIVRYLPIFLLGCGDEAVSPDSPVPFAFVREWPFEGSGLDEFCSIAVDSASTIYVAIRGRGSIQRFSYHGEPLGEFVPDPVPPGVFAPTGLAATKDGCLVVANGYELMVLDQEGRLIDLWGRFDPADSLLGLVFEVAIDADEFVYVAGYSRREIFKYTLSGEFVSAWPAGSPRMGQRALGPYKLSASPRGRIYMVELQGYEVQEFSEEGRLMGKWGEIGITPGQLHNTTAIAVGSGGEVFVADLTKRRILEFRPDGAFVQEWGEPFDEPGGLLFPVAMTVTPHGDLFVVDGRRGRVLQFSRVPQAS